MEYIDRSQHQTEKAAGRQRESSALSKPTSVLLLIFCFVRVLPSSTPSRLRAPPPPSLSAMTTQKAGEMGRGGEEWRREQKREKGEHLVCRALISIALGEQALPTFPHKNIGTNTHAHIQSLTHSVMVGPLPAPPWG